MDFRSLVFYLKDSDLSSYFPNLSAENILLNSLICANITVYLFSQGFITEEATNNIQCEKDMLGQIKRNAGHTEIRAMGSTTALLFILMSFPSYKCWAYYKTFSSHKIIVEI